MYILETLTATDDADDVYQAMISTSTEIVP